jgi:hypothetical protein
MPKRAEQSCEDCGEPLGSPVVGKSMPVVCFKGPDWADKDISSYVGDAVQDAPDGPIPGVKDVTGLFKGGRPPSDSELRECSEDGSGGGIVPTGNDGP